MTADRAQALADVQPLLSPHDTEWLPPEAPLDMPEQDFGAAPAVPHRPRRYRETDLWRVIAIGITLACTFVSGAASFDVFQVGGFTPLELIAFGLSQVLFLWINYSVAVSFIGFTGLLSAEPGPPELDLAKPIPRLKRRTAILMPVYNEDPEPVFARLRAMDRSLAEIGAHEAFHVFVLSDSRSSEARRAERAAFQRFRAQSNLHAFYRARPINHARKAGNIADWVRRFGDAYDHMVVLDADSLMSGETLARLAACMEGHPRLGLLQTAPSLINRTGPFGRLQQFACRLYGPMLSEGVALLWGSEGNYWGHNAIIRTKAFAAAAGLPKLQGPRPFGGEIMSHDFVEAALLRRAGWDVRLAPQLGGSFEECPPTLPDLIVRDRRWCQGNLQHVMVVGAKGLHWMSRFHLVHGVMAYLMSPLWFLFLVAGACLSAERAAASAELLDRSGGQILTWVASIAFLSLFIPRILGLILALVRPTERRAWGDLPKLMAGVVAETLASVLIAPILMVSQTKALFDIFRGKDSGWAAQTRDDGSISWREACRRHAMHTLVGLALAAFTLWVSTDAFLWMLPVPLGLIMSAPISVLTADPRLGAVLMRWGLFVTPEELDPPLGQLRPEPPRQLAAHELQWPDFEPEEAQPLLAGE
jgi:membrane glycosyltransferase